MSDIWLYLAAALICVTGLIHSILGERLLIAPMLTERAGVLRDELARKIVRFAWHFTTVLMFITAATLIILSLADESHREIIAMIGVGYLGVGLFDAVITRGRHIGWWFLTASGCLALFSLL